ncbi:MAG: alanine racemase [Candidatus Eisenbacteria bacterium]|nr:alanine racemase [Candidatus Eisenbacteria bacterium]
MEISRSALRENLDFLRGLYGGDVLFSSVVKGNAYGHGAKVIVPLAEDCGVRHFSVFSADEALGVVDNRTAGSDVLIMGYIDDAEIAWAVEKEIGFFVFDQERLRAAGRLARRIRKPARIHLELETGLHRSGLEGEELDRVLEEITLHPDLYRVEGICTHLAGAESSANYHRIRRQIRLFEEGSDALAAKGLRPRYRHAACSAASIVYPETVLDLVRIGIAQYGFWPSEETRIHYQLDHESADSEWFEDPLRRVMRWSSRIMGVKRVPPGGFVGYGTTFLATRSLRIASVPVGYYHGFPRNLSNLGHVLVRGKRAPVTGLVNMNMMMVDVTECGAVRRGDEVVIVGRQKKAEISVQSFSALTRNVNYEVLVRIPAAIPRVLVD